MIECDRRGYLAHESQVSPVRDGRNQRHDVGERIKEINA
jgi:hypothetical protein